MKRKAEVLVPGQWLLATLDGRKVFFPNPNHERGRNCGFGGNQTSKIIGTGTIGNSSISINNVWLVDGLRHNLLSISQFFDNGYDVLFVKNNCIVINKDDQSIVFKGKRRNNVYKGRIVKTSFKPKDIVSTSRPLELLHIDLFFSLLALHPYMGVNMDWL